MFFYINEYTFIVSGLQNLCISSSLVCVIILLASLVVFWVGFILRQVPPVLIVSVLYVLAGERTFDAFKKAYECYIRIFVYIFHGSSVVEK